MPAFIHPFIVTIHVIVSLALILIILLQTGKGADIGAVFGGGGSNTLFGSSGPTSFLSRLTAGAAVVFMLTSLFLAYFAGNRSPTSIMKGNIPIRQQMPAQKMPTMPTMPTMPAMPPAPAAPAK